MKTYGFVSYRDQFMIFEFDGGIRRNYMCTVSELEVCEFIVSALNAYQSQPIDTGNSENRGE